MCIKQYSHNIYDSLQQLESEPDPPGISMKEEAEAAPSPTRGGRGRRGKGRGRGGVAAKTTPDPPAAAEADAAENSSPSKRGRGRGRASRAQPSRSTRSSARLKQESEDDDQSRDSYEGQSAGVLDLTSRESHAPESKAQAPVPELGPGGDSALNLSMSPQGRRTRAQRQQQMPEDLTSAAMPEDLSQRGGRGRLEMPMDLTMHLDNRQNDSNNSGGDIDPGESSSLLNMASEILGSQSLTALEMDQGDMDNSYAAADFDLDLSGESNSKDLV